MSVYSTKQSEYNYTYRLYDNNMYTYIQGDPGKSLWTSV